MTTIYAANQPYRTGSVGSVYYWRPNGIRLSATDTLTIDQMVRLSARWPNDYSQYVGTNGYVTWARGGIEIDPPKFVGA